VTHRGTSATAASHDQVETERPRHLAPVHNPSCVTLKCLDLCCGKGGWAKGFISEGWEIVGVDLADFSAHYPGRFIRADLLTWGGVAG
jgi:ubiquinone/menaquinone biosynthesis C-methylase UbiE